MIYWWFITVSRKPNRVQLKLFITEEVNIIFPCIPTIVGLAHHMFFADMQCIWFENRKMVASKLIYAGFSIVKGWGRVPLHRLKISISSPPIWFSQPTKPLFPLSHLVGCEFFEFEEKIFLNLIWFLVRSLFYDNLNKQKSNFNITRVEIE